MHSKPEHVIQIHCTQLYALCEFNMLHALSFMLQVHTLHTLITNCKDIINKKSKESWKESNATQIQFLLLTCETTLVCIPAYICSYNAYGLPTKTDKIYLKLSSSPYTVQ